MIGATLFLCSQMFHFSDSLSAISGSAMTLSLVKHEHARQAEIGIFELLQVSGFISCLALITSSMIAFSFLGPVADARGRCAFNLWSSPV